MATLRYSLLAFVTVLFVGTSGCNSSARQPSLNGATNHNTREVDSFKDSDWSINLVRALTSDERQRRVRCKNEQLCWVWDEHSVWIAEGDNSWRNFYAIPAGQASGVRIKSVFLESPSTGWVIQGLALYKIQDGGRSVTRVIIPGLEANLEGSMMDAFFADNSRGWIVGGRFEPLGKSDPLINTEVTRGQIRTAYILHTKDGGATWEFVDLPRLIGGLEEINFWSNRIGIAASRSNLVFTNDGGKTWNNMVKYFPSIESERGTFDSGYFLDENHGWLLFTGFDFEALVTNNGGKSWMKTIWKIESKVNDTSSYPPSPRFAFVDETHGIFIYNHFYGGELFKTSDAGRTWSRITANGGAETTFTDAFYESKANGLLVGNKGIYSFRLN